MPEFNSAELAGGIISIDLKALRDNYRKLARLAGNSECAATVKADCYGLGLAPCVRALRQAGCQTFFTALPCEGAQVRATDAKSTIYVLDGLFTGQAEFYARHGLRPVLAGPEEIAEWAEHCRATGKKLPAALHVETGINRLGLQRGDIEALAAGGNLLEAFELTLVLSHLACGDTPAAEMNLLQKQRFDDLRALLPDAPASLANSPGVFLGEGFACDVVRPGIALYGGNPFAGRQNPMAPVVRVYAPLLQVRTIASGESAGYGASFVARRETRMGIIGVGYGDGYRRALSGRGNGGGPAQVMVAGQFAPVIGRVSMDMIAVDLSDVDSDVVRRGTRVELMGGNISVDELAHWAGTIPYEILTGLGSRLLRVYSGIESAQDQLRD